MHCMFSLYLRVVGSRFVKGDFQYDVINMLTKIEFQVQDLKICCLK